MKVELLRRLASARPDGDGTAVFATREPFERVALGEFTLAPGWWQWNCSAEGGAPELRLFDSLGLLSVFRTSDQAPVTLYVGETQRCSAELVLSAWPGAVRIDGLELRRLSKRAIASILARRITQALRSPDAAFRILKAARAALSGSSLSVRSSDAAPRQPIVEPEPEQPSMAASSAQDTPRSMRMLQRDHYVCWIGDDETLDQRTDSLVAEVFRENQKVQAIYGDLQEGGQIDPTPSWDDVLAQHADYASPPYFFRTGSEAAIAPSWRRMLDIASGSGADAIRRIPLPLAVRSSRRPRNFGPPPAPVLTPAPPVSVVIPTKIRIDLLKLCIESLTAKTDYADIELVIVNNGATDPTYPSVIDLARESFPLVEIRDAGDFNFSRLVNAGVGAASGEIVLLMNDDVRATDPSWLVRMIDSACTPHIGAVGARLHYTDNTIQHAGIALGLSGVCGHMWRGLPVTEAVSIPQLVLPSRRSAVTAACMAVKRSAYLDIGGFDEEAFPVTLNDVDFCLRLEAAGLPTIYRGDAALVHDEGRSRGFDTLQGAKRARRMKEIAAFRERWGHRLFDDPYSSPAFDLSSEAGRVSPAVFDVQK